MVSIVDVASKFIPVNKVQAGSKENNLGNRGICTCPFCTNGIIKSMILSEKENKYKCFSCGETGDTIDFLEKAVGMDKGQAMDYINSLEGKESHIEQASKETNEILYKANSIAANTYYCSLKANNKAYHYLKDRGISDNTIKKFALGYSNYGIGETLKRIGMSDKSIQESGLAIYKDGKYKDKIFNRIMFPIMVEQDGENRVVGFGGRLMKYPDPKYPNAPKYLNTSATPIFDKKRVLFAFNYAKHSTRKGIILCEGYMDALALHQAAYDNATATLGTACTMYHAKMIKEKTDTVYLCYDSDDAGIKAKLKAIPILRKEGLDVKILSCVPHKDPDEYIKAEGRQAFQKQVLDKAMDSYEYEIRILMQQSQNFEKEFGEKIYGLTDAEYKKYIEVYKELTHYEELNSSSDVKPSNKEADKTSDEKKDNVNNTEEEKQEKDNLKKDLYSNAMDEIDIGFDCI